MSPNLSLFSNKIINERECIFQSAFAIEINSGSTEINQRQKKLKIGFIGLSGGAFDVLKSFEKELNADMYYLNEKEFKKNSSFENYGKVAGEVDAWEACSATSACILPQKVENSWLIVELPFLGIIDLRQYSLLLLSMILWFVDGFNPCAMWVLVMFLSILANTGSRKKMFQVAWIFVIAEAIMYYMILNVWYKTWDFIKLDNIITPAIGVLSIGAGAYFLYEFFTSKDNECKVISSNQKKKTIDRIKAIASKPMNIGVFFLTIAIAFSVNIVEFACSIGIPQAYTKLLELSHLSFLAKQWFIMIYTFFYMIDDFVVFWVAIYAIGYLHITTKYTRYCLVLGGVIMIILWYFFLFNPTALKMIVS